jgi:aminoglycoside phosphotransferase (APT) family kinase protein
VALGEFVVALGDIPAAGEPDGGSYRARGLRRVDGDLRQWVERLPDDIGRADVLAVWEDCLSAGDWTDAPRWLHSDLRGDNLIARAGVLVAVIDWEGCAVGDPSADCLAAWWLFDRASRESFRVASGARPGDWLRAKGWALYMAVAAIPYYRETNPVFAGQARAALREVLTDD